MLGNWLSGNFAFETLAVSNFLEMNTMILFLGTKPYINLKIMSVQYKLRTKFKVEIVWKIWFFSKCPFETIVISNSMEIDIMKVFVGKKYLYNFENNLSWIWASYRAENGNYGKILISQQILGWNPKVSLIFWMWTSWNFFAKKKFFAAKPNITWK